MWAILQTKGWIIPREGWNETWQEGWYEVNQADKPTWKIGKLWSPAVINDTSLRKNWSILFCMFWGRVYLKLSYLGLHRDSNFNMFKSKEYTCTWCRIYFFLSWSLLITVHCRTTSEPRHTKTGPSKKFDALKMFFFLLGKNKLFLTLVNDIEMSTSLGLGKKYDNDNFERPVLAWHSSRMKTDDHVHAWAQQTSDRNVPAFTATWPKKCSR